ncbi:double-strand break repair protein AddB [Martelella sp. HB161492]|uniref:double-strand break repair protein AddB n=1 Tax=Martelella sp. HB161492 TaxID=2720726 RepID=UPI0015929DAC|nr:double-strand break repair protein AddB [Martelella sp. HB161492]
MTEDKGTGLFTIPPGAPFLATLAKALLAGRLAPGFSYQPDNPLSLADVVIFLPTRRAARVLRAEFAQLLGGGTAILPQIRPLGETDEDEALLAEVPGAIADSMEPIAPVERLLELAGLILPWRNRLSEALAGLHGGSPLIAPASPADAVWLARDLAELIDAMETEGVDWAQLNTLNGEDYAIWWQLTAEFLNIAALYWPERLDELGRASAVMHRNRLLAAEALRLSSLSGTAPVIIAGSTGSVPAIADLIAAVASLPQGVVVLPGLDLAMEDDAFSALTAPDADLSQPEPSNRAHPQYEMARLIERLGETRAAFTSLGQATPEIADRNAILAEAFAPAERTDGWGAARLRFDAAALDAAFADTSLIEASNEREEALSIAIALRLALDEPRADGRLAISALITPDRALARRVTAELKRFAIDADDSAGTPLLQTLQGTLMVLMLETALKPGDPAVLAALIKHPLARFGLSARDMRLSGAALELIALRGGTRMIDPGQLETIIAEALEKEQDQRHIPRFRSALPKQAPEKALDLGRRIQEALVPLCEMLVARGPDAAPMTETIAVSAWAERTGRALEAVALSADGDLSALWGGEAGERLSTMLSECMASKTPMEADGPQWIDIAAALIASDAVKPRSMGNPRVFIFGAVEARLQEADTIVIGGMNEGVWPTQPKNNPFLSRGMKAEIGLEPPEKRIGQLAHDFTMAAGTKRLIFTRALRQGSAPTVASRWLQRLGAFAGADLIEKLAERGALYRHYAAELDRKERQRPAPRPEPKPPAEFQPERYSFSEIGRLRRDPYAIYAAKVLKLDPLLPFNADPGMAERGTLYHAMAEQFLKSGADPKSEAGRAAMTEIVNQLLMEAELPPHLAVSWEPRIRSVAEALLTFEADRQARLAIDRTMTEAGAGFDIPLAGVRLTGIADRIDLLSDGSAEIIDYKTGLSPSVNEARALLEPQLPLEAAALAAGAFRDLPATTTASLKYVRLRPGRRFDVDQLEKPATKTEDAITAMTLAEDALKQFSRFITLLKTNEKPFTSRLIPARQRDFGGEYDHLARVAEWMTAEDEEGGNGE